MKHGKHLEAAMKEVHKNIPSTVVKAKVTGKKKEAMLRAIAFSKAKKKRQTSDGYMKS